MIDNRIIREENTMVKKKVVVAEKLEKNAQNRLAKECAKLDPKLEQAIAEEGFTTGLKKHAYFHIPVSIPVSENTKSKKF